MPILPAIRPAIAPTLMALELSSRCPPLPSSPLPSLRPPLRPVLWAAQAPRTHLPLNATPHCQPRRLHDARPGWHAPAPVSAGSHTGIDSDRPRAIAQDIDADPRAATCPRAFAAPLVNNIKVLHEYWLSQAPETNRLTAQSITGDPAVLPAPIVKVSVPPLLAAPMAFELHFTLQEQPGAALTRHGASLLLEHCFWQSELACMRLSIRSPAQRLSEMPAGPETSNGALRVFAQRLCHFDAPFRHNAPPLSADIIARIETTAVDLTTRFLMKFCDARQLAPGARFSLAPPLRVRHPVQTTASHTAAPPHFAASTAAFPVAPARTSFNFRYAICDGESLAQECETMNKKKGEATPPQQAALAVSVAPEKNRKDA